MVTSCINYTIMSDTLPATLLTDLYQLTMAYGYWKEGIDRRESVFHLAFRKNPFESGFTVAAGLGPAIEYLQNLAFGQSEVDYLASLRARDGSALFDGGFFEYLRGLRFECDVDAIPEGTVVFQNE